MVDLKICFVGIGSIAKRHISNIKNYLNEDYNCQIDAFRSSNRPLSDDISQYITNEYQNYDEVPKDYDAIFITNPTKFHFDTLKQFKDNSDNFFIEKPIVDSSDLNKDLSEFKSKTCYVACPLRHGNVIQYIKKNIDLNNVNGVRSICSTYLPEWHPDEDYRKSYSAKKDLGGGVSIDLIHEWDYLTYLFGMPSEIYSILDKVSDLEIDTEDIAVYIAKYQNMLLELHLDYFGRFPIREIMIFKQDETIVGDIYNNKIIFKNSDKIIDFNEERNDYQVEELKYFFNLIINKEDNINDIENALKVMKLAGGKL
ncbi:MAG: Gfo/Idh/MocA family oxidoreductase [Methanobrevibacter millerae]|uniref:Gfo/Idh/MocA family oxidoreductase n=2 Tax=Methanobrevibacter millerae TaxID=230361 RepID=A0A8T3VB00_9EURY|nr:Gfo/Idh/MocA family oxidoreductase [Methanobrevibacter millerae]